MASAKYEELFVFGKKLSELRPRPCAWSLSQDMFDFALLGICSTSILEVRAEKTRKSFVRRAQPVSSMHLLGAIILSRQHLTCADILYCVDGICHCLQELGRSAQPDPDQWLLWSLEQTIEISRTEYPLCLTNSIF